MFDLLQARQDLGSILRGLRRQAGLSVRALATACGWLPSKIILLEDGRELPTHRDVAAWVAATSAVDAGPELQEQLRALENAFRSWQHQSGQTSQRRWLQMEAAARQLRSFEPHFVPGLLQTAAYARLRLEAHARLHYSSDDVEAAVAARLQRQELLGQPDRKFSFLITEYGLRPGAYGGREVMAEQIEKILRMPPLEQVQIGVIPSDTLWDFNVDHGFWIFDRSHVIVETVTAELRLTDHREVATYSRVFEGLEAKAVRGQEAREVLGGILEDLSTS
jgi:hypothetical protein